MVKSFAIISYVLLLMFSSHSLAQDSGFMVWNETNIAALAVIGCGVFAEKSETLQYQDQFLFHEFHLGKNPQNGKTQITGRCGRAADSNFQLQEGDDFYFEFDQQQFNQETNPVLMGFIGSWGFKFYFKSVTQYDGEKLKVVKILRDLNLFSVGTAASRSILNRVGLLGFVWSGSENLNPTQFGISGFWQDASGRQLNLLGMSPRLVEEIRIWSSGENKILMNASLLTRPMRSGGDQGDAVFFQKYGPSVSPENWIGCSFFVSTEHKPLDEEKCRQLWKQVH